MTFKENKSKSQRNQKNLNSGSIFNIFKNKNQKNQEDKKTSKNNLVYYGSAKKPIPTRSPFNKRRQQIDHNYVPNRKLDLVVKDFVSNLSPKSFFTFYTDLKSGKYLREINFWIQKYLKLVRDIFLSRTTQKWLISIFILCILSYALYISTFSTEFLVKKYKLSFSTGSFVDKSVTQKIIQNFNQKGLLGIVPDNHFWFLNSQTLTAAAKEVEPTITNVDLISKQWPNEAEIKISTEPILTTLKINSDYYLVSYSGKIIGQDYGGFRKKVVIVQASHKNVDSEELTKVFAEIRPDSFVGNNQLNRLFYIDKILPKLEDRGLNIVRTEVKSLFERDTDVFFVTDNETKLLFDGLNIPIDENIGRLDAILETTQIGKDMADGKIDYIDLRVQNRVYVCYKGRECQIKTNV
jgi:cell division septal protein FtsQ